MKLGYRSQKNAESVSRFWGKSLDKPEWYKIEALSDDEAEILIYDVIGWPFNDAGEFVRVLSGMKQKTITVRINTPGGDVFDGLAIFHALQSHSSKIITRNEGLAASMGSIVALAGKERQMYSGSMMMIHEPWAYVPGNQYELREVADLLEKISGNMLDIYTGASHVGKREMKQIMSDETWFTAKEAKEKGFIDSIVNGKSVKAQFDISMFYNTPEGLFAESLHEPTEREIEKALRDVGVSKKKAKAMLAGCLHDAGSGIEQVAAEIQKTIAIIGG